MTKPETVRVPSPCFLLDEGLLRRNLSIISNVAREADVEIIVALKAFAMWSVFPIMLEYVRGATASSLAEAKLVHEYFGDRAHTYAPVYAGCEIDEILDHTKQITFNSLSQFERYGSRARSQGISCGLRINPEFSTVKTDLYNPCVPGSRLGVRGSELAELPDGIEGLHFHTLCESGPEELETTLKAVVKNFGHLLPQAKWLNMGGGHLMTREGYDRNKLVTILREFKKQYPNLHLILEPGSAFTWQTGWLISTVEDIIERDGITTLMLNVSFACHMPDCLEMPYKPSIVGARDPQPGERIWRIGGNSCLAGDFMGDWTFDDPPKVGDNIIFEDMIHYTMVKTTMFNGVSHPSIALKRQNGTIDVIRRFGYGDYKGRMS